MAFQFLNVNPAQAIAETKAYYEGLAGYPLSTADVEMIMINVIAYHEQRVLAKMESCLQQSFPQLANGVALDYWGEIFNVARLPNEEDDDYRVRVMAANGFAPIGTRASYIAKAKGVLGVLDCNLQTKQDNPSMAPGVIKVCVLQRVIDIGTGTVRGTPADATTNGFVLDALSDTKQNIVGDMFTIETAVGVSLDGTIEFKKVIGSNSVTVANDLQFAATKYLNEISVKFKGSFDINELHRRLLAVPNVYSIVNVNFPSVPVLSWKQFYEKGSIVITEV
ncbi:MAG: baseplate J/gp47 family protein [Chitinophagales bacterium]|nr:baseplate J/gp47 family protein [Chitinophagales bacterium]